MSQRLFALSRVAFLGLFLMLSLSGCQEILGIRQEIKVYLHGPAKQVFAQPAESGQGTECIYLMTVIVDPPRGRPYSLNEVKWSGMRVFETRANGQQSLIKSYTTEEFRRMLGRTSGGNYYSLHDDFDLPVPIPASAALPMAWMVELSYYDPFTNTTNAAKFNALCYDPRTTPPAGSGS